MRKKHGEAHENHERWLVSYADFITLLFAFFVVMYSISAINEGKFRVLSEAMTLAFRTQVQSSSTTLKSTDTGGMTGSFSSTPEPSMQPTVHANITPDLRPIPNAQRHQRVSRIVLSRTAADAPQQLQQEKGASEHQGQQGAHKALASGIVAVKSDGTAEDVDPNLAKVSQKLRAMLAELIKADMVNVHGNENWVEIEIKNSILFPSGSAVAHTEAMEPLKKIAEVLREVPNRLQVEGFTDNRPIKTAAFPSNWELSAARAANIVHILMTGGVRPERMAAIGYGEYHPVGDNGTEEGRQNNRRVVLVILGNNSYRHSVNPSDVPSVAPPRPKLADAQALEAASGRRP